MDVTAGQHRGLFWLMREGCANSKIAWLESRMPTLDDTDLSSCSRPQLKSFQQTDSSHCSPILFNFPNEHWRFSGQAVAQYPTDSDSTCTSSCSSSVSKHWFWTLRTLTPRAPSRPHGPGWQRASRSISQSQPPTSSLQALRPLPRAPILPLQAWKPPTSLAILNFPDG